MKKAALYTRIDRREVSDPNESLAGQEKELREYCEKNNIEVVKVLQEINLDGDDDRRELVHFMTDCLFGKADAQLLLFTSIDKLSHNPKDLYYMHHNIKQFGLTPKAIRPINVCIIKIIVKEQ